ncbi:putative lipid II flippase FtsW [Spartinivicinus poritis]|uniref:Probable peptidoglycan glycosyltransferase FtsW n=1 Tax=Spartinivicinus poritis TaxID=2994640 RepID=A0ABT5U8U0_9GAMM|nr:putative lipid II flippase FtsW [Spartinivicinus sp. A2-2]MDE1462789.1 putative lipid II flippase FtsW [Spartinivicinus sp. A2-2]
MLSKSLNNSPVDLALLLIAVMLLALGLVMVTSASIEVAASQYKDPLFHFYRQLTYLLISLLLASCIFMVPMNSWLRFGPALLFAAMGLLIAVLLIGREINGSVRWISLGLFNLQASELAKLFFIVYLAGYSVRQQEAVQNTWLGLIKPMGLLSIATFLLLLEPDFGAVVVLMSTAIGMLFMAGVKLWRFSILILVCAGAAAAIAVSQPYRMARLTTYIDPWSHQFDSGYQLTQALIAFGRGEWFGVGLGNSIQKSFYLPEAHTDFVFAVLAEETGLVGALLVISLLIGLTLRSLFIGLQAQQRGLTFSGYLAYGIGLLFGMQSLINIGVNTGLLPTKGLTLPFLSYGGSSLIVNCLALAVLFRIGYESRLVASKPSPKKRKKGRASK